MSYTAYEGGTRIFIFTSDDLDELKQVCNQLKRRTIQIINDEDDTIVETLRPKKPGRPRKYSFNRVLTQVHVHPDDQEVIREYATTLNDMRGASSND